MARITIEKCLKKVQNRFELVHLASKRARILSMTGEEPLVPWNGDKPTVVALREIEEGYQCEIKKEALNSTLGEDSFNLSKTSKDQGSVSADEDDKASS